MSTPAEDFSQSNTLVEGQIFEGRYQILSILGRGGVGIVYKARQTHMDKIVAIKTLLQSVVSDDDEGFQRFQREARTASSLDHVNIIRILDFGKSASGLVFLVMEYLGDRTFEQLLLEKGCLDVERFWPIASQICDGLYHAHKHQVVHRDIKPSNVMLLRVSDDEECVKIVDFGLAKLSSQDTAQSLTQTGAIIGTPLFMSPEQCRGLSLDHRSDIYSLGCMFYLALTGRVPIQGATALDTLFQHTTLRPPSFAAVGVKELLPPRLEAVIFKAMEKEPDMRYQSMLDFRSDLQKAIFDPDFRPMLAQSTIPTPSSLQRAQIVTAEEARSAKYADLVDSAQTVVSMNKSPESLQSIRSVQVSERPSGLNAPVIAAFVAALLTAAGMAAFFANRKDPPPVTTISPHHVESVAQPAAKASAVLPQPIKEEVKVTRAPVQKAVAPKPVPKSPSRAASSPALTAKPKSDFEEIASLLRDARSNTQQKNWAPALSNFETCVRLQARNYGATDYRLFPTLANVMHCQIMLGRTAETRSNLMAALQIFNSEKAAVLEDISKKPQAAYIWRTMAKASFANGAPVRDRALLQWSADFYELCRGAWKGDKSNADYVHMCEEYCQSLDLCGNRKKENEVRASINLPPLPDAKPSTQATPKAKRIGPSVRRNGSMVIRSY